VLAAEETARELLAIRQGVPQPAVLFVSGYQGAWGVGRDGKRAGAAGGLFFGLVLDWPATRRSGTAFVMITLGLSELVSASAYVFIGFFGAEKGVTADRIWHFGSSVDLKRAHNPKVAGSNPAPATTEIDRLI
jgi:hypothetical protein